ncbi:hypothetical protein ACH50O_11725 [Methylomonas sp. 2BW1-5-20]|uniref:hypothetical protein n=1 Tax=Methylomonas sp. 2BW1-5-20 TaxID=3376686 RepID=UPI00404CE468
MKQNPLMQKATVAEMEAYLLGHELARARHRLEVANKDVRFYVSQASIVEFKYLQAVADKNSSHLDLMNSGISHREYLRFVRSTEPCRNY